MTEVIIFIVDFFKDLIDMLNSVTFDFFGYSVSIFYFFIALIIITMVVSIFWKGAKG